MKRLFDATASAASIFRMRIERPMENPDDYSG